MSLNRQGLVTALLAIFTNSQAPEKVANDIADAIEEFVCCANVKVTIPQNTFLVSADNGVKNNEPILVEGEPDESTGGIT